MHYKGNSFDVDKAPNKKIIQLLKVFQGTPSNAYGHIESASSKGWVYQLLSSPDFGKWVTLNALEFDLREGELLCGKKKTKTERIYYWSKWEQMLPFSTLASKCDLDNPEEVLSVLEVCVQPELRRGVIMFDYKKLINILPNFFRRKILK